MLGCAARARAHPHRCGLYAILGAGVQARSHLEAISRRRLFRAWQSDPTIPGSTIELAPGDLARVRKTLDSTFSLNVDAVQEHGRELTPCALNKALWAGAMYLRGLLDHRHAEFEQRPD